MKNLFGKFIVCIMVKILLKVETTVGIHNNVNMDMDSLRFSALRSSIKKGIFVSPADDYFFELQRELVA